MDDFQISVELAKTIGRERQEETENYRLLRQAEAGGPSASNRYLLSVGRLSLALGPALKLRQGKALRFLRVRNGGETPQESSYNA